MQLIIEYEIYQSFKINIKLFDESSHGLSPFANKLQYRNENGK